MTRRDERLEVVREQERVRDSVDVSDFDRDSWDPVPLLDAASAGVPARLDHGRGLVYGNGTTTLVSGEPGVGKSILLAAFVADEAIAGRTTIYLDFERTPELLLERLQAAGLNDEEIQRVRYLRPKKPDSPAGIAAMVERLAPSIVVVDAYDSALALFGLETKNEDVRKFAASVIDPLRLGGASVPIADHVPKDREKRGRYSIGAQSKLALADAHLGLSVIAPLRRGAEGKLRIRVHKDTFGYLPPAAVFTFRSHELTGAISWDVSEEEADFESGFRPSGYMERVSRELEIRGEFVSRNEIERAVQGKAKHVRQAIDALVREEFAEETDGLRGARLVRSIRAFREDDE